MILALYPLILGWGVAILIVGLGMVLVSERMQVGTSQRRAVRLLGWLVFIGGFVVLLLGIFAYEPDVDYGLGQLTAR
jgi:hypothetical protein